MVDLYTKLIVDVNKAIDPIENGATVVAKAAHAAEAENAENVRNSGNATHADSANSAEVATFSSAVANMDLPLAGTSTVKNNGIGSECFLEDGVYLVVYQCDYTSAVYQYKHNPSGVLAVKAGLPTLCRLAQRLNNTSGASVRYDPRTGLSVFRCCKEISGGGLYENFSDNSSGTLYFYKIGTLEQEES